MTGAPMPEGADAIVMVERTSAAADGRTVRIDVTVPVGEHVRIAGDDLRPGMVVIEAGTALRPGHLGVLASLGIDTVTAHRRARVGVLSTGDEIIESGPLAPGQIRDSNRPTLLSLAIDAGCEPVDLGRAPDDADAIRAAIDEGVRTCDALLSSGGVSMGDFDYVKAVLGDVSGDMAWMQVAIRPAKPFAFGTLPAPDGRHIPVFGLPGNPVSSMVSFELFARPALRKMMGHRSTDRPRVEAVADEPLRRGPDGKIHFARVVCGYGEDGRFHIRSAGGQGSHQLGAMAVANALAVVPDGDGVEAGGTVTVMLLDTSWSAPAGGR
jgi:molybdenum cofactor synthesis domain-containing protein